MFVDMRRERDSQIERERELIFCNLRNITPTGMKSVKNFKEYFILKNRSFKCKTVLRYFFLSNSFIYMYLQFNNLIISAHYNP